MSIQMHGHEDSVSLDALDGAKDCDGDVVVSAFNLLVVPSMCSGSTAATTVTVKMASASDLHRDDQDGYGSELKRTLDLPREIQRAQYVSSVSSSSSRSVL